MLKDDKPQKEKSRTLVHSPPKSSVRVQWLVLIKRIKRNHPMDLSLMMLCFVRFVLRFFLAFFSHFSLLKTTTKILRLHPKKSSKLTFITEYKGIKSLYEQRIRNERKRKV